MQVSIRRSRSQINKGKVNMKEERERRGRQNKGGHEKRDEVLEKGKYSTEKH
jgi:hypothetical protein